MRSDRYIAERTWCLLGVNTSGINSLAGQSVFPRLGFNVDACGFAHNHLWLTRHD
jgi:hypothetical protein